MTWGILAVFFFLSLIPWVYATRKLSTAHYYALTVPLVIVEVAILGLVK